jgi:hypothetical protein
LPRPSLVRATLVAKHALTSSKLCRSWRLKLDAIVEMLAVTNVTPHRSLAYEQEGLGIGSYQDVYAFLNFVLIQNFLVPFAVSDSRRSFLLDIFS